MSDQLWDMLSPDQRSDYVARLLNITPISDRRSLIETTIIMQLSNLRSIAGEETFRGAVHWFCLDQGIRR